MRFNEFEIFNILVGCLIVVFIARQKDTIVILWSLFIYGALHYIFSLGALTNYGGISAHELHLIGSGILAEISALIVLGISFIELLKKSSRIKEAFHLPLVTLPVLVLPIVAYLINYRHNDWLQFKNIISIEALLLVSILGARALIVNPEFSKIRWIYFFTLIFLIFSSILSVYEVTNAKSWASTVQSSGIIVSRASASLFNPNLLGFFASLVYLAFAYGWNKWPSLRWESMFLGLFFSALLVYYSGSRSAAYVLMFCLFITVLLLGLRSQLIPALIFPGVMILNYLGSLAIPLIGFDIQPLYFQRVSELGVRFFDAIPNLILYLMSKIGLWVTVLPEVIESIEGRFIGEQRDSGWIIMYEDTGILGILSLIWGVCILFFLGIKKQISMPSIESAYSLALFANCLLVGVYMRFQNFPVWIFISAAMAINLYYWIGHSPFLGVKNESNADSNC